MTALDSNVLVRFLIEDALDQTNRAAKLIENILAQNDTIYVSDIALCQIVWVLKRCYSKTKTEILSVMRSIQSAKGLIFDSTDSIRNALDAYEHGKGDFADYLIREQAHSAGCETVATFDKALIGEEGFIEP